MKKVVYPERRDTDKAGYVSFYVSIVYIVSLLLFNITNHLIPHIMFLVWIISAFVFNGRKLRSILSRKYYLALYIFLVYYFASSLFAFPVGTCINRVYTTIELVSPFIMYELYLGYGKRKIWLCLAFIAVFSLNFHQLMTTINYSAIAGLRQHQDDEGFLNTGFHFIYSLTLVFCFVIYALRMKFKGEGRGGLFITILLFLWLVLIAFVIFRALLTTALLLLIIGTVLALFYGRKNWKRKLLLSGVIVGALFVYIVPFVEKQLLSLDNEYSIVSTRLNDVSQILSGSEIDQESSFAARAHRTVVSLQTFITHPVFGVNHKTADASIYDGSTMIVGNHAEWADSLAEYGVFAFLLFAFLLKSMKQVSLKKGLAVVFILYVIIGFFNPVMYCVQNTICFYIIPFFYDIILIDNKKENRL